VVTRKSERIQTTRRMPVANISIAMAPSTSPRISVSDILEPWCVRSKVHRYADADSPSDVANGNA